MDRTVIARASGTLVLDGIYASTLATLGQILETDGTNSEWIVCDLSLGAWRGHQAASEFAAQLGLLPSEAGQLITARTGRDGADTIGVLIDAETSGDRNTLIALDLATQVVVAVRHCSPRVFLLIAPRYGLPWEPENVRFIQFLAQGLHETGSRLILVCTNPDDLILPTGWRVNWLNTAGPASPARPMSLLDLTPGVVAPHVAQLLQSADPIGTPNTFQLSQGYQLVAPENRGQPGAVSRLEYDRLALVAKPFKWLEAYAQFHGNNLHLEPALLCAQADERFGEGGYHIALRLLQRASECAPTPLERSAIQLQAQNMRIALQWFEEAVQVSAPSRALPPELRGSLLLCQAWAMVMVGDPNQAEAPFQEALELLRPISSERAYLYALNVYALNRLKLADLKKALALEHDIEANLARLPVRDWHLEYVNSINIARLHRRRQDFEASEYYFQRAFATTLGLRSESDSVYINLCWARLNAERSRPAEAFLNWLRVGLHWAAQTVPEAIAPRVATALVGRRVVPGEDVAEEVSAAIHKEIARAASAARVEVSQSSKEGSDTMPAPVFIYSDHIPDDHCACAIGAPGWGILITQVSVSPQFAGENHQRLRSYLYQLLRALCPVNDLASPGTIVVDNRLGREIPVSAIELLEVCVRLGVPKMIFGNEEIELREEVRRRVESHSRLRLAGGIDCLAFEGSVASVSFKRYLKPKVLSSEESAILAWLDRQPSLSELMGFFHKTGPADRVAALVRSLERSRIVELCLPDDICWRMGIGRLSSEMTH